MIKADKLIPRSAPGHYLNVADRFAEAAKKEHWLVREHVSFPTIAAIALASLQPGHTLYRTGGDTVIVGKGRQIAPIFNEARSHLYNSVTDDFSTKTPERVITHLGSTRRACWTPATDHAVTGLNIGLCLAITPRYWGTADQIEEVRVRLNMAMTMHPDSLCIIFPPY